MSVVSFLNNTTTVRVPEAVYCSPIAQLEYAIGDDLNPDWACEMAHEASSATLARKATLDKMADSYLTGIRSGGVAGVRRSGGVTASAVACILGAVVWLLFAATMVVARFISPARHAQPAFVQTALLINIGFFVMLAGWSMATGIGLLKLKLWARISAVVFNILLALLCLVTAVVMVFIPLPTPPNVAPGFGTGIKVVLITIYLLGALLGAGLSYFLSRTAVKIQFTGGSVAVATEGARPVSITVIAALLLFTALSCLVLAFLPMPTVIMGVLMQGWSAHLILACWGLVSVALGAGLLKLNRLARRLAIVYFVLVAVNGVLYVLMPGLNERLAASMAAVSPDARTMASSTAMFSSFAKLIPVASLINLVPIWFLVKRRAEFERVAAR